MKLPLKVALLGLLAGFTPMTAYAASPTCTPPPQSLKQWRGFANLQIDINTHTYSAPAARALRTQAEYEDFIRDIPTQQLTKRQPAPPSQDPLLAKPVIDFSRHMLLVMFRDDSVAGQLHLCNLTYTPTTLTVHIAAPALKEEDLWMARPIDVGVYLAVLIPRFEGEVVFTHGRPVSH